MSGSASHHTVGICPTIAAIRTEVVRWRAAGETVALVPTMGALHEGHLSLVRQAKSLSRRVVVSIFVNPAQFAPNEDFASYPRQLQRDLDLLESVGIDAVFTPDAAQMYPKGFATTVTMTGPAAAGLEDASRPIFFNGVATVVAKLLIQVSPDAAVFGEKDFQQLAVIRQLARDLDLPVRIVGGETVREADGLAMSSRNVYLDPQQRQQAGGIYRTLQEVATALRQGEVSAPVLAKAGERLGQLGFKLDYLALRDAITLSECDDTTPSDRRLLVAAWLGRTRLIDNIAIAPVTPDGAHNKGQP